MAKRRESDGDFPYPPDPYSGRHRTACLRTERVANTHGETCMRNTLLRTLVGGILAVGLLLVTGPAQAATATLTLVTTGPLVNVDDTEGRWQFDGGNVFFQQQLVGHFARTKRVSFAGTSPQNTAMVTITIFLLGANPPDNLTLQGSHSFNSGGESGSVSAASAALTVISRATFTSPDGSVFTLTF